MVEDQRGPGGVEGRSGDQRRPVVRKCDAGAEPWGVGPRLAAVHAERRRDVRTPEDDRTRVVLRAADPDEAVGRDRYGTAELCARDGPVERAGRTPDAVHA